MNLIRVLTLLAMLAAPCRAAISILIEPGPDSHTTCFTVTQTSASPILDVQGLQGYAFGISIPNSMFNIPDFFPNGPHSDIFGDLSSPVATISEVFSGQTFLLNKLRVSAISGVPSLLGFDQLFTIPLDSTRLQFNAASSGPVLINIAYEALAPGTHSVNDTLFGLVTVTVVPEPSVPALFAGALAAAVFRRMRNVAGLRD